MAMIVDKAGRDDLARGIARARRRPRQFADLDDLAVLDRDIAAERRAARAVDDAAVLNQQIIGHPGHSFFVIPARAGIQGSSARAPAGVDPDLSPGCQALAA